jgi:membrane protein required for beta-lactamase induction
MESLPPPPPDASPNQLLAYIAEQSRRQTAEMARLAHDVAFLKEDVRETHHSWRNVRQYIGCTFWIFVGLPLVSVVVFVILSVMGIFSVF